MIEFIDGEDLAQTLEREGRLGLDRLLPIMRQVIPALDFVHARGVVHCDLKPANVRVRRDGRAFLLDLGIAKIREGSALGGRSIQSLAGLAFGTLEYLAPELAHGREGAGPASDVYSLGVMIFECLAGKLPFLEREPHALVAAHERSAPPDLAGLVPGLPIAVCDLVLRCLAKKPADRPAIAGEVLRELEAVVAPPPFAAPESRPTARRVSVLVPPPRPMLPPTRVSAEPLVSAEPPLPADAQRALSPPAPRAPLPPTRVATVVQAAEAATIPPRREAPQGGDSLPSAVLVPAPERHAAAPVATRVASVPSVAVPVVATGDAVVRVADPALSLSSFSPDALAVTVLSGRSAGLVQVVEGLRGELVIGRDPSGFLVLAPEEDRVSRRHAALVVRPEGVSIRSLEGDVVVEGKTAGTGGLPLARGAIVRLGDPGVLLVLEPLAGATERRGPRSVNLRRVDRHAPRIALDRPTLLGRAPEAATTLDPERDALASNRHAQISPRAGFLVLEDLGSANGTFLNGQRVHAAVLKHEDEIALGGREGPRFLLEVPPPSAASFADTIRPAHARPRTAKLGRSCEPVADSGDALRGKLEVDFEGRRGVLFLFAGTRLRFGRNANRGARENDLVLRAFPRAESEDPKLVEARTRDISGHHGTLLLTRDGIAVRDDGSTLGTELDGAPLARHEVVPLSEQFVLEIAKVLALRGRVIRVADGAMGERLPGVEAGHPLEALRLERTRDGEHMSYVLLVREVTIGSGEEDAVFLPHEGVQRAHAKLAVRRGRFVVGASEAGATVMVSGRPLATGELVELEPGAEIVIGRASLRYSPARDEDMKP